MTNRQGQTIAWSSYNYPTVISAGSGSTAETVDLYYGPDRQRWYQYYSGNSTTEGTYYIGGQLEKVTSGSTSNYRHYIYAGNEPVAVYSRKSNGTNAVDYFLTDHQSSMAAITSSTGGVVVNESFTPYGNRRNATTWSGAASNSDLTTAAGITRQGYTFQTQLGLWMGMNHMNGRVEDSLIGRFMSADTMIPDPTNPQSYNRYSYVYNNPVTATDPTGFDCDCGASGSAPPSATIYMNATADPWALDPWLVSALPNPDNPQAGAGYLDFFDPSGLGSPPAGAGTPVSSGTGTPAAAAQAGAALQEVQVEATRISYDADTGTMLDEVEITASALAPTFLTQWLANYNAAMSAAGRLTLGLIEAFYGGGGCSGGYVCGTPPGVGILRGVGALQAGPRATLQLANQILGTTPRSAQTIALLETVQGPTLVAGGTRDLSAAQIAMAQELGLTVAGPMPGFDAEVTLLNSAGQVGLTPTTGVATNLVCPSCVSTIEGIGGWVNGRYFGF